MNIKVILRSVKDKNGYTILEMENNGLDLINSKKCWRNKVLLKFSPAFAKIKKIVFQYE